MFPDTNPETHNQLKEARIYLLLSLAWMAVIFAFSHQAYSGRITEEYLHDANIPVRKLGHVSEFAILSLLYFKTVACYCLARSTKKIEGAKITPMAAQTAAQAAKLALPALVMAFVYACLDEWHQAYVPGRSSSFTDVLVDTTGIVIALGLTLFVTWRRTKKDPSAQLR
jgi:VanZ family protein